MKITYWSDFACPYCYIGNIRLKRAIEELEINGDIEFDIRAVNKAEMEKIVSALKTLLG